MSKKLHVKAGREPHAEENAFNQKYNTSYLYQASDIRLIQSEIIGVDSNNFKVNEPIGDLASAKSALKAVIDLIDVDRPVGCIYNLGNFHWVTFTVLKIQDQITILYKDSQGNGNEYLEKQVREFSDDVAFITNRTKEQTSGVDCGIFALENMRIIARELSHNVEGFIKRFEEFEGFCPLLNAKKLRKGEFAESYVTGKYQEMAHDAINIG